MFYLYIFLYHISEVGFTDSVFASTLDSGVGVDGVAGVSVLMIAARTAASKFNLGSLMRICPNPSNPHVSPHEFSIIQYSYP
jgi:hypothetical protein